MINTMVRVVVALVVSLASAGARIVSISPQELGAGGGSVLLVRSSAALAPALLRASADGAVMVGNRPCVLLPHRSDQLHKRSLACRAPPAPPGTYSVRVRGVEGTARLRYRAGLVARAVLATHGLRGSLGSDTAVAAHTRAPAVAEGETILMLLRAPLLSDPAAQLSAAFTPRGDAAAGCHRARRAPVATQVHPGAPGSSLRWAGNATWHWHVPVPQVPCGSGHYEMKVVVDPATRHDVAAHGTVAFDGGRSTLQIKILPTVSDLSLQRVFGNSGHKLRLSVTGSGFAPSSSVFVGNSPCRTTRADAHLLHCTISAQAMQSSLRPAGSGNGTNSLAAAAAAAAARKRSSMRGFPITLDARQVNAPSGRQQHHMLLAHELAFPPESPHHPNYPIPGDDVAIANVPPGLLKWHGRARMRAPVSGRYEFRVVCGSMDRCRVLMQSPSGAVLADARSGDFFGIKLRRAEDVYLRVEVQQHASARVEAEASAGRFRLACEYPLASLWAVPAAWFEQPE